MELLDKGIEHDKKIKEAIGAMLIVPILIMLIPISSIIIWGSVSSTDIKIFIVCIAISIIIILVFKSYISRHKNEISKIDKMTDLFYKDVVNAQIIAKSIESYIKNNTKYHEYIVSARITSGKTIILNSKDLYFAAKKGEYVDIEIKEKLDKNKQVLDSSYIPLLNTIKQSI